MDEPGDESVDWLLHRSGQEPFDGADVWDAPEVGAGEFWDEADDAGLWPQRWRRRRIAMGVLTAVVAVTLLGGLIAGVVGAGSGAEAAGHAKGAGSHGHASHQAAAHPAAAHQAASHPAAAHPAGQALSPAGAATTAQRALLALTDLPSGWTQAPGAPTSTTSSAWSKKLADCVGLPASVVRTTATKVSSPNFTSGDKTLAVEDAVSVFPTARQARAQFAAMAESKTPGCMSDVGGDALRATVQHEAGSGTTVGQVTFAPLDHSQFGSHETGFTVTIPLAVGGHQLTITSTEVDFTAGRMTQQITLNGNGTAFPPALAQHVILALLGKT